MHDFELLLTYLIIFLRYSLTNQLFIFLKLTTNQLVDNESMNGLEVISVALYKVKLRIYMCDATVYIYFLLGPFQFWTVGILII